MIDIAILRAMAAAGATADVIISAVELAIKPELERRAKDAQRKRRDREIKKRPRMSTDVHGHPGLSQDTLTASREEEESKKVSKEERERPARKRARSLKAVLPENWVPPSEDFEPSDSPELEKMRDWARSNAVLKADWLATWRNWKRRAPQFNGRNGNGRERSVLEAGKRIDAKLKAMGATDDYIPGSSGPKSLELDKPVCANGPRLISSR